MQILLKSVVASLAFLVTYGALFVHPTQDDRDQWCENPKYGKPKNVLCLERLLREAKSRESRALAKNPQFVRQEPEYCIWDNHWTLSFCLEKWLVEVEQKRRIK